mmetsp:Transcript_23174/g.57176  ORF Transcript_23174/g.57176 Transcript_23174/m.57176 type:complete len:189 (+) Transcript_23174:356-922(+)|eukprot:CAMPEP_0113644690 /NCGR_PEP_ID=MMETSP0017_2-20120614/23525_1 /TAXON_ID=2856 /ORGANISM="Cylindrotheca closterium" /LENGTH=188 /DNA_ID=CAMNT_0000556323 /DNA_START=61 /DNA_END=627 /DNA_ORIENTATION=+ /assembly_acc=CAM_ASM_000147
MPPHSKELTQTQPLYEHDLVSWGSDFCSKMVMETMSFGSDYQPEKRRRVAFSDNVEIFEIPHLNTISSESKRDCYFSREEITRIHMKAWEIVDHMNLGIEFKDANDFSKRGLVDLKDTTMQRRQRQRQKAYKVVFGMQAFANTRQPMHCGDPRDFVADLYSQSASDAKKEAYMSGIRDAIAAGMASSL